MLTTDALALAKSEELDLVEVSTSTTPPVCKIMDFGKFLYAKEKEAKKKKSKQTEVHNIKIGPQTASHDLTTKARKIAEFLEDGDVVRIEIFLRGRQKMFHEAARKKLMNFVETIQPVPKIEQDLKKSPSGFNIIISKSQ